jgi:FAD/FMN-containing dehydrogenase
MDIASLIGALDGLTLVTDPAKLRQKSRDFYWYSPVLKRQLDGVRGDLLVEATSEQEVIRTLRACHAAGVPVTVRGGGSGNYGQAMPLEGGVVLDLARMDRVLEIGPHRVRAEAGAKLSRIDQAAAREESGQELRFHPSTLKMGTLGGFVPTNRAPSAGRACARAVPGWGSAPNLRARGIADTRPVDAAARRLLRARP